MLADSTPPFRRAWVLVLVLLFASGCRPRNRNMFVIHVQGQLSLANITQGTWEYGEILPCYILDDTANTFSKQ